MRLEVLAGLYWGPDWKEPGDVIEVNPDKPDDLALVNYYTPFGNLRQVPEGEPSSPEGGEGGDTGPPAGGGTEPMSSGAGPVVGRRPRPH